MGGKSMQHSAKSTGVGQLAHDKPASTLTVVRKVGQWNLPVASVCCPACQATVATSGLRAKS